MCQISLYDYADNYWYLLATQACSLDWHYQYTDNDSPRVKYTDIMSSWNKYFVDMCSIVSFIGK
jgi:hypothetical protein